MRVLFPTMPYLYLASSAKYMIPRCALTDTVKQSHTKHYTLSPLITLGYGIVHKVRHMFWRKTDTHPLLSHFVARVWPPPTFQNYGKRLITPPSQIHKKMYCLYTLDHRVKPKHLPVRTVVLLVMPNNVHI